MGDYCRALAERGELLPAALVHDEIDREAKVVEAHWHSENDLWKLKLWIRLAAFADDPAAALPDPSQWPEQIRHQHGNHDLLFALGYSPAPTAPHALEKLRRADQRALFGDVWARALATPDYLRRAAYFVCYPNNRLRLFSSITNCHSVRP